MLLSDIKFEPRYSPHELLKAVTWLSSDVTETFAYATNYAIIGTNPETKMLRPNMLQLVNQPCHRQITANSHPFRSLVATECGWKRRSKAVGIGTRDLFEPFFNWLTKESFAKRFFAYADMDVGFVVSADMYTPLMQNIMIITRHFYEVHENGFIAFNALLEAGVPGDVAYPLAFNSTLSQKMPPNSKFTSMYSHRVTHLFGMEEFKNWINGDTGKVVKDDLNDPQHHYRVRRDYLGGKDLFWNKRVDAYAYAFDAGLISALMQMEDFRNELSVHRKGSDGTLYKAPNPFAPKIPGFVPPAANEVSNEEVLAVVGPYLARHLSQFRKES